MHTAQTILKNLRASGLSQSEIARRSGIPQPRLSRWEAGEAPRGADDALKLAALADELATTATATQAEDGGHA